ncbi:MAG: hypothetical protein ACJ8FY_14635 [Gemmataceae bacterium]
MATALLQPKLAADPTPRETASAGGISSGLAGGVLALFLIVNLPLFLSMPLDCDIHFYDVCARNLLRGGVHYRDTFDTNLPGMPWLHTGVRYFLGWSVEAIRLVDVCVLTVVIAFLLRWLPSATSLATRVAFALVLYCLYFSVTEWCHCQRDFWMLAPCLLAMELRGRQLARLCSQGTPASISLWAFFEGVVWSIGFWIKPFVAVPALGCWILCGLLVRRRGGGRSLALDGLLLLGGGLASGAVGMWWLWQSGSWPYFCDIFFVWNRDYVGFDMTEDLGWLFIAGSFVRFFPWVLVHLIAVPVAVQTLWSQTPSQNGKTNIQLAAIFYLAWLFQAVVLQHFFDYIQLPAIFLGLALAAWRCATTPQVVLKRCLLAFFLICPVVRYPILLVQRLPFWERSLREGSTAPVKDGLTLLPRVEWCDLEKVEDFLRQQHVRDGELTCFSIQAISLYNALEVRPSMRHLILQGGYNIFSSHREQIRAELANSSQRYIVVDLWKKDRPYLSIPGQPGGDDLPDWVFPKNYKELYPEPSIVLFRAGRYMVLAPCKGRSSPSSPDSLITP